MLTINIQLRFWRHLLHQRETYMARSDVSESGGVLESPHFMRADSQARDNPVLQHLLHHLALTSEDKTNYYSRLLSR